MVGNPGQRPVSYDSDDEEQQVTLLYKSNPESTRQVRSFLNCNYLSLLILLFASVFLNIVLLVGAQKQSDLGRICNSYTSQHASPVTKSLDISYSTVRFNASVEQETIYRRLPDESGEVDEAWEALGLSYRPIAIPEEEAEKYGLEAGQVKRLEKQGGGFVARLEYTHQLHCLNMLRQTAYWNYPYYLKKRVGQFNTTEELVRLHAGHCLDIIRQQLMCKADVTVYGQWWVKDEGPWVDFSTDHKCKNFEGIREWAEKNQIGVDDRVLPRPDDTVLLERPLR